MGYRVVEAGQRSKVGESFAESEAMCNQGAVNTQGVDEGIMDGKVAVRGTQSAELMGSRDHERKGQIFSMRDHSTSSPAADDWH